MQSQKLLSQSEKPLTQAIRFEGASAVFMKPPRLAFVGAGGKTTALFQMAREMLGSRFPAVLVTTTTHLGAGQTLLADNRLRIGLTSDLPFSLTKGVTLFTGPVVEEGRLGGLDTASLERLLELADLYQAPLLIEADGSRMRPLKAPAAYEPVLPKFVDKVVVVAGLSGLGKPLTEKTVHRPLRFAVLAGLVEGEQITAQALAKVLVHPQGGLKSIPAGAKRILLLNQADTDELKEQARNIAGMCLRDYHAVVISSLTPESSSARSPSPKGRGEALTPGSCFTVFSAYEPTAIILLAAGASSRFGSPKQLLDWQGQPLVRHVASLALSSGCESVRVVVGAYGEEVIRALDGLALEIVENPSWQEGQASSVRAGLQGLPPETGAAIFMLVDQPLVPVSLLRGLLDLHAQTLSPLVAPRCQGRRANPVLFDRVTFPELLALQGDMGGRALFASPKGYEAAWLPWEDERLLWDFDTEEDLKRMTGTPISC